MQRFVILLSILLSLCAPAWAVEVDAINGIPVSKLKAINGVSITKIKAWNGFTLASAFTCTAYVSNSTTSSIKAFHRYNSQQYEGIIFDDGSTGSICAVKFSFYDDVADGENTISAFDYYAEVWLLGAGSALDTLIQRSAKVDGNPSWADAMVEFSFSTPADYDCSGSNQYGVLIKSVANDAAASTAGVYSGTVYPRTLYSNGTNNMTGCVATAVWNSATKALNASDANDMPKIEIWTKQ